LLKAVGHSLASAAIIRLEADLSRRSRSMALFAEQIMLDASSSPSSLPLARSGSVENPTGRKVSPFLPALAFPSVVQKDAAKVGPWQDTLAELGVQRYRLRIGGFDVAEDLFALCQPKEILILNRHRHRQARQAARDDQFVEPDFAAASVKTRCLDRFG